MVIDFPAAAEVASLNYYVCATFLLGVKLIHIEAEGDMWHDMRHETKEWAAEVEVKGEKKNKRREVIAH